MSTIKGSKVRPNRSSRAHQVKVTRPPDTENDNQLQQPEDALVSKEGREMQREPESQALRSGAAATTYGNIVSCRISPKTATISGGQSQAYSLMGVFGDTLGN